MSRGGYKNQSATERALHVYRLKAGDCAGQRIVQVPVRHLIAKLVHRDEDTAMAEAELQRRGRLEPQFVVTMHAIDRASTVCRRVWLGTKDGDEGVYTWLHRLGVLALEHGQDINADTILFAGVRWTFKVNGHDPVLVTVHTDGTANRALAAARQQLREIAELQAASRKDGVAA